ncbi:MAG: hypothetical protein G01um101429_976 [Parcubacteria group bacterium Gr01-1014_29]|nr:MAG: hypothetical protein G01um101429_976 [Parcubacteria group bacterium Gr01-1014_29]
MRQNVFAERGREKPAINHFSKESRSFMPDKKIIYRKVHGGTEEVFLADLSFRPSVYGIAISIGIIRKAPKLKNTLLNTSDWDIQDTEA